MAEDNVVFAKANALFLEPAGLDVTVAYDGLEAWTYAQQSQYDLFLTDYDMPKLKGADLCRRIRRVSRYASTPIVLMTCYGRDLDVLGLRDELQLSAVLKKPIQQSALLRTINECLSANSKCSPNESDQLDDILCDVKALKTSTVSAIRSIFQGQRVMVLNGPLEGV